MPVPRVLVYSHEDEPLFELDPTMLRGLVLEESVNGEHSLSVETEQELEKEQRVFVIDGGRWKEFVVTGSEESRDGEAARTYYCVWSLQHDLSVAYIKSSQIGDAQHLHGATDAIAMVASATDRWQVGTVDNTSQSSGWFYYTSAWDALSRVVSQWAGEVDATITMSDPIRRAIDFYAEQGDQDAKRRFDYGRDLTGIQRSVLDDAFVCRIVPRGKGELIEGSTEPAYGRRITIESVSPTGEEWIQDDAAAMLVRLPDGSGGWEYPTRIVIYEDIEEPAELLAAAQRDLQQYTRPKVGYSASVLALTGAGMDAQGVELGDAVQVVDKAFGGDGLRIEARVVGIARNLLDDYDTQLTIGNFQPSTADVIKKLERAQSSMAESVIDTDGKAEASIGIAETAQQVAAAVNQHFWTDENGAHVTEVTKDEWNDSTGPLYQSGANSLWNSLGMLFRKGLTNLLAIVTSNTGGNATGVSIYDGNGNSASNIVASFGSSGATVGKSGESHLELDYHSMQLIDKEGSTYFHVSDLRNADGLATIVDTFTGDGSKQTFKLSLGASNTNYTVTVDGVEVASDVTKTSSSITFSTAPAAQSEIVATYTTTSDLAKAYTLGIRASGSNIGAFSVAEGGRTVASGSYSHAEGNHTRASSICSHAEGDSTTASGYYSHAEGYITTASGIYSHAEGGRTAASSNHSHAEGCRTVASGSYSHAEGYETTANGNYSHAQNNNTIAASEAQTALGRYNVSNSNGTYAVILGNGTDDSNRSNAMTIDWDGNEWLAGRLTANGDDSFRANITAFDSTAANPSAAQTTHGLLVYDSAGVIVGQLRVGRTTDGKIGIALVARQGTQASGGIKQNAFWVWTAKDGTATYTVPSPTNFREAISSPAVNDQSAQVVNFGAGNGTGQVQTINFNVANASSTLSGKRVGLIIRSDGLELYNNTDGTTLWLAKFKNEFTNTVAQVITAASGFTISQASYVKNGQMGQWYMTVKTTNAMSANTQYTIGTIVSGKRPATWAPVTFGDTTNCYGNGRLVTGGNILVRPSANIAAGSSFYLLCSAYILA